MRYDEELQQIAGMKGQLRQSRQKEDSLNSELESLHSRLDKLRASEMSEDEIEEVAQKFQAKIRNARNSFSGASKKSIELSGRIGKKEREFKALELDLLREGQQILMQKHHSLEKEIATKESEMMRLKQEVHDIRGNRLNNDKRIAQLQEIMS